MPPRTVPPLPALTGLRFVAALYVVLFHTAQPLARGAPPGVRTFLAGGYVSVGLFFVLSGFILVWAYQHETLGAPAARRRFWVARLARIYPVYLLGLALSLPYFLETVSLRWHDAPATGLAVGGATVASAVTLTQAWIPPAACLWNCPGWSLSAEAFFYLLFPVALVASARLSPRRLLAALAALWALMLVPPTLYAALDPDGIGAARAASRATWLAVLKFDPLLRLPEFLLGVVAGRLYLHAGPSSRAAAWLWRLGPWLSCGAAAAIALLLAHGDRLSFPHLHNGLLAPAFVLLVVGLAAGGGPLAALLATRPLQALGEASYALYVLHLPVFLWSLHQLPFIELGLPHDGGGVALYLGLVTLLSLVVHQRIEQPARRWIVRWLGGARRATPRAEPSLRAEATSA